MFESLEANTQEPSKCQSCMCGRGNYAKAFKFQKAKEAFRQACEQIPLFLYYSLSIYVPIMYQDFSVFEDLCCNVGTSY